MLCVVLTIVRCCANDLQNLQNQKDEPDKPGPTVVKRVAGETLGEEPEFDVCVCGGTLGVLVALALQVSRGERLCKWWEGNRVPIAGLLWRRQRC